MSVVSAGKAGPGRIVPGRQGGPRKQRRFDTPFALGMAAGILINLMLLMALYFRADPEIPQRAPEAIPVELVKQPPAPKPEDEPEDELTQTVDTKYLSSGGTSQTAKLGHMRRGNPDADRKDQGEAVENPSETDSDEKKTTAKKMPDEPIGPIPDWARNFSNGYNRLADNRSRYGARNGTEEDWGGNAYLNKMQDRIHKMIDTMAPPKPPGPAHYDIALELNGRVSDVRLTKTSGNDDFDRIGTAAILRAGPYPPPPAYVRASDNRVHIQWTFYPKD